MTSTETSSVGSLVSSLVSSFKLVPPAAIPPMLDCILTSTGSSASAIFFSLLDLSKVFNFRDKSHLVIFMK